MSPPAYAFAFTTQLKHSCAVSADSRTDLATLGPLLTWLAVHQLPAAGQSCGSDSASSRAKHDHMIACLAACARRAEALTQGRAHCWALQSRKSPERKQRSLSSNMASSYDPIRGPFVKNAFGKAVVKGEDTWLQQRGLAIPLSGDRPAPLPSAVGT